MQNLPRSRPQASTRPSEPSPYICPNIGATAERRLLPSIRPLMEALLRASTRLSKSRAKRGGGPGGELSVANPPGSIQEAFPSPGARRSGPQDARPAVKQRMTALRSPFGAVGLWGVWQGMLVGSTPRSILSEGPNGLRGASVVERAAVRRGADMERCDSSPTTHAARCPSRDQAAHDHAACPIGTVGLT